MVKLLDILYPRMTVWITDHEQFGAKNSLGQVRYFEEREDAEKFAQGTISGPKIGRPEPKQHKQHHDSVEKYSK